MAKRSQTDGGKWEVLSERLAFSAGPWFDINVQKVLLPDGRIIDDYFQIRVPDAVVLVCLSPGSRIVMIKQYLHGLGRVSLVLPSGTVQKGESPLATAKRELKEETGYACSKWKLSGVFAGHNNYGCGKIFVFSGSYASQKWLPDSGDLEEMEVCSIKRSDISKAVRNGQISAFGTVAALAISGNIQDRRAR